MTKFKGKLLIIGCGSVSQCAVPLVLQLIDMPAPHITIMDFVDNRARVKDALAIIEFCVSGIALFGGSAPVAKPTAMATMAITRTKNVIHVPLL